MSSSRPGSVADSRPNSKQSKTPRAKNKPAAEEKKTDDRPKRSPKAHLHFHLKEVDVDRVVPLLFMPESYFELQTEIARYLPRFKQIVIVRDEEKNIVTSKNFHQSPIYHISEVHTDRKPQYIPVEPLKWDFTGYHGRPAEWVDALELKKAQEEEKRAEEAEENMCDDDLFGPS